MPKNDHLMQVHRHHVGNNVRRENASWTDDDKTRVQRWGDRSNVAGTWRLSTRTTKYVLSNHKNPTREELESESRISIRPTSLDRTICIPNQQKSINFYLKSCKLLHKTKLIWASDNYVIAKYISSTWPSCTSKSQSECSVRVRFHSRERD